MTTTQRPIAARTKAKALSTLDNMSQIIEAEMLVHGAYIEAEITRPERAGTAICNGQRACALGTMYVAYGVAPKETRMAELEDGTKATVTWSLPGCGSTGQRGGREDFVKHRPGLSLVYYTMKRLAQEWAVANGHGVNREDYVWNVVFRERDYQEDLEYWLQNFDIETLFESYLDQADEEGGAATSATRQVMLDLVAAARKEIEGLPVAA